MTTQKRKIDTANLSRDHYVYLLYDRSNKEIFYVGKGKGSRFLDHLNEAQKGGDYSVENAKLKRIRQIGPDMVGCVILRSDLTNREALLVEAATIDLLRATNFKNIKCSILNIQNGHCSLVHGITDILKYKSMKKQYVKLLKSETLLCLKIQAEELMSSSFIQHIHKMKWKVDPEEASKATYTVVEADSVVIAVFYSNSWNCSQSNGGYCTFNGKQVTDTSVLDRLIGYKLPRRRQGMPLARYINHTDIKLAK